MSNYQTCGLTQNDIKNGEEVLICLLALRPKGYENNMGNGTEFAKPLSMFMSGTYDDDFSGVVYGVEEDYASKLTLDMLNREISQGNITMSGEVLTEELDYYTMVELLKKIEDGYTVKIKLKRYGEVHWKQIHYIMISKKSYDTLYKTILDSDHYFVEDVTKESIIKDMNRSLRNMETDIRYEYYKEDSDMRYHCNFSNMKGIFTILGYEVQVEEDIFREYYIDFLKEFMNTKQEDMQENLGPKFSVLLKASIIYRGFILLRKTWIPQTQTNQTETEDFLIKFNQNFETTVKEQVTEED